jgi:hypothetical protein
MPNIVEFRKKSKEVVKYEKRDHVFNVPYVCIDVFNLFIQHGGGPEGEMKGDEGMKRWIRWSPLLGMCIALR